MKLTRFALLLVLVCGCEPAPRTVATLGALTLHPSIATSAADGPAWTGDLWHVGASRGALRFPIPLRAGDRIREWILDVQRESFSALGPTIGARLEHLEAATGRHVGIGMGATDNTQVVGPLQLRIAIDPPWPVTVGESISLTVAGDGVAGDLVGAATVYVVTP